MRHWCCLCGAADVDPSETCPVSEYEMQQGRTGGHGLRHLISRSRDSVSVAVFNGSAAESRAALARRTAGS